MHVLRVGDLDATEHVRMAVAQLRGDPRRDVLEVERLGGVLLGHPGLEHDLEQQVAELLAQVRAVPGLHRLGDLEDLLDRVADQALVRLLGVPGATAGRPQPVHHLDQVRQVHEPAACALVLPADSRRHFDAAIHGAADAAIVAAWTRCRTAG